MLFKGHTFGPSPDYPLVAVEGMALSEVACTRTLIFPRLNLHLRACRVIGSAVEIAENRMERTSVKRFMALVMFVAICAPLSCHAQRDPEAAARQARIDRDTAEAKAEELQREQAIAADVQIDNTQEMAARREEIAELQAQANVAERRRREVEAVER